MHAAQPFKRLRAEARLMVCDAAPQCETLSERYLDGI